MKTHRTTVRTFKPGCTSGEVVECGTHDLPSECRYAASGTACISPHIARNAEMIPHVLVGDNYYCVRQDNNSVSVFPEDAEKLAKQKEPQLVDWVVEKLRERRQQLGMSQREAADLLGQTPAAIANIESGSDLRMSTLAKLLEAYKVPPVDFFRNAPPNTQRNKVFYERTSTCPAQQ